MLFNSSKLLSNSVWGLVSTMCQTVFLSLFFVIVSRHYPVKDFSDFLVANTVYQLLVGISSMGLGHWFVREYETSQEKSILTYSFIKIQAYLGIAFYVLNVVLAFVIYSDPQIRILGLIFGTNIIFDNIIYAIKNLNVAEMQQRKSAVVLALDGFLRLLISCILFVYPLSLVYLSILLVVVRLLTVNAFLALGSQGTLNVKRLLGFEITFSAFKASVLTNWRFILIVGSAIIFWRSATIIISKYLTDYDVANYEIAYKIFSIFTMLAIVTSTTVYPKLVKYAAASDFFNLKKFYELVFFGFSIFSFISFSFIQSYSSWIIDFVFGSKYTGASICMQQMFLTFLVFPTVFLQANLLVALKKEKADMFLNLVVLGLNLSGCFIGLHFSKSLSVINYSIFGAFVVFHLAQSVLLIQAKISTIRTAIVFYSLLVLMVILYDFMVVRYDRNLVFIAFILFGFTPFVIRFARSIKRFQTHQTAKPSLAEVKINIETIST